jgi:hypothetical protein
MVSALKAILASARSPGFAIPAFLHAPARARILLQMGLPVEPHQIRPFAQA